MADENSRDNSSKSQANFDPTQNKLKYLAEVLHIVRPICHCNFGFWLLLIIWIKSNQRDLFYIVSALFAFGSSSWKQLLVPLAIDFLRWRTIDLRPVNIMFECYKKCFFSLMLMNGTKDLSILQKKEMRRRTIQFFFYLVRSPMYDNFSR